MNLSYEQFIKKAKPGYRVPIVKEFAVKKYSPVQIVEALNLQGELFALLESGKGGENLASHTFICYSPNKVYQTKDGKVFVNNELIPGAHPYRYLEQILNSEKQITLEGLPKFCGGAVGFVSYDAVRYFEKIPESTTDDTKTPDLYFLLCDRVIVLDNLKSTVSGVINLSIEENSDLENLYRWAELELEKMAETLQTMPPETEFNLPKLALENLFEPEANMTKAEFEYMVKRAKEYIAAGDVFQVNLSVRLAKRLNVAPWKIYKILRSINPSPYGVFINFADLQLVGSSPELLVRVKEGKIAETRPIAGTRRRGQNREEDLALAQELINNEKERAEHIMLVDLERNDLGRVCDYGTVHVNELMVIEEYSHVMHIVSNVRGRLAGDKSNFDLLQACFPGGTITGAPKIRCMEIIEELEPTRRGVYTGSAGYFGYGGQMEMNISIRTLVVKGEKAYVQAGAGIVADSVPEREYYESLKKAEALLRAIELAERE